MKKAGIICEYNPFHLGHARQLRLIKESLGQDTAIVCAMSGNYVQRGAPAMWDKFTRAKAAVACGADVVLELPITCVLQSAEGFANGGVEVLSRFGVDHLSFGAECGDGTLLMDLAKRMDSDSFPQKLREGLDRGLPYAAARQLALENNNNILSSPNNILGLEYCRAILSRNCTMQPLVIQRTGGYHDSVPTPDAPSATAVRRLYPSGNWSDYVPAEAAAHFSDVPWYDVSYGERAVLARLRSLRDEEWMRCAHGSEGLWSKAMKAARSCGTLEEIIEATKSKRYPRTRIQRLLLCAYLGITQEHLAYPIPHVRLLALSEHGRTLVRQAKKDDQIVLVNPGQEPTDRDYYTLETRASDLFTLFSAPHCPAPCRLEQDARLF